MKIVKLSVGALSVAGYFTLAAAAPPVNPAPNGITLPAGYQDWRITGNSHRTDNNTLPVVLGDDIAVAAARDGHTHPWPEGAILDKLVWKELVAPIYGGPVILGDDMTAYEIP